MKDSNEVESRSSKAIANQPAQLQSKGAALAAPSQARSNISPPSTNQEVVQKQLDLDAELLVLGGQLSFGAKFKGLFGSETSFSKIEKLVKEYSVKKSPATKQTIIAECNAWLTSDSRKSVKDGDDVKKASITRIRNGLKNDEAGAIDLTILSDKVSTTNKIKEAITGEKSTYQKLEQSYLEYQQKLTSYEFTAENVKIIVEAVREVDTLVDLWKTKHPEELGNEKGKEVINIQNNIGKLSMAIKLSDYLSLSIKGIKLSSIKNGIFEAESGEVKINILDNNIKAIVTKPVITENSADWETATLEKSDLKIGSVSIKDLSATIKGKSADYAHTLSAETFDASLENLISVSGEKIEYDSAKKEFKADSAKLALTVLGKPVSGELARPKVNKEGIDWETASITLPDIKLGTVNIEGLTGTIGGKALDFAYTISSNKFNGKIAGITYSGSEALYDSKTGELSAESAGAEFSLFDKTIKGEINKPKVSSEVIEWDSGIIEIDSLSLDPIEAKKLKGELGKGKSNDYSYKLSSKEFNGTFAGVKFSGTDIEYDSKEKKFSAATATADMNILDKPINVTIHGLVALENRFDFTELSTDASGQEFNVKIFTLKAKKYKISKNADDLDVLAEGSISLDLPEYLGAKAKGEIEGEVGVSLKNGIKPVYKITGGEAELAMPNPLLKIGELLGGNWAGSRYELSATIPVFTGVSAIFGIYMQFAIKLADELKASIKLNEKGEIDFKAGSTVGASFEGGIFGGIQGGSQFLIALAILLRAALKVDLDAEVGYQKTFQLGEAPKDKKIKEDKGFTYMIKGEATAGVYLDIVATALYFFRKQISWELGTKSLGAFEFSNDKTLDPKMGDKALVDKEAIDKEVDPSLKTKAQGLKVEELLSFDYSKRFKDEEKKEVIDVIKEAEAARLVAHNKPPDKGSEGTNKFNNVALANLQFYHQFIDNRCKWAEIYNIINTLGPKLKTEEELKTLPDGGQNYLQETVLINVKELGKSTNIAQVFVDHYKEKVKAFSDAYNDYPDATSRYLELLKQKGEVLQVVENLKKNHLHSGFLGDEAKQKEAIKIGAWFGQSDYQKFAGEYALFSIAMISYEKIKDDIGKIGEQTAFKLVQEHQRKVEKTSAPVTK